MYICIYVYMYMRIYVYSADGIVQETPRSQPQLPAASLPGAGATAKAAARVVFACMCVCVCVCACVCVFVCFHFALFWIVFFPFVLFCFVSI